MAEAKTKEEGESASSSEHTPPPSSLQVSPCPNPRKRKNPKDLPSLSNCHSCGLHFPPRPQTLTSLNPLDSEWRIVLLCDQCLRLVKSASACSYCFSDFSGDGGRRLDCRQCSRRIHLECVPAMQRSILSSVISPESFVCVDCCALPRFGNKNPRSVFTRVSVEELMKDVIEKEAAAAWAKENALKKAKAAKCAVDRARDALDAVAVVNTDPVVVVNTDPVVKDQQLALQLHLAMNGSQRISRTGRSLSSRRSVDTKKARQSNGCLKKLEKVEFCTEDKSFLDSWDSSERKDQMKEADGCSSTSPIRIVAPEEQGSCSEKITNSSEDNSTLAVWITYRRASKLNGVGCHEKSSGIKQNSIGVGAKEISSESEQISEYDLSDRYAKKYSKRKKAILALEWGK